MREECNILHLLAPVLAHSRRWTSSVCTSLINEQARAKLLFTFPIAHTSFTPAHILQGCAHLTSFIGNLPRACACNGALLDSVCVSSFDAAVTSAKSGSSIVFGNTKIVRKPLVFASNNLRYAGSYRHSPCVLAFSLLSTISRSRTRLVPDHGLKTRPPGKRFAHS